MASELVCGRHAVAALAAGDPAGILEMWLQEGRRDARVWRVAESVRAQGVAVHRVPRRTLDRLLPGQVHQGVAVRYRRVAPAPVADLATLLATLGDDGVVLVLDRVRDPHNLGAVLRSADAAGAAGVVVPRDGAAPLGAAARKAASGAADRVPLVRVANLARALETMAGQGVRVVGLDAGAPGSLFEADLGGRLALVLGAEDTGLRDLTRRRCDVLVRIPMAGSVASLNVSVAAGVCLYEARRRRGGAC